MKIGTLEIMPASTRPELMAEPTRNMAEQYSGQIDVVEIDPALADTAAFCERYQIGLDVSANCVIVKGMRGEEVKYAACMILATTKADVNNVVKKYLDVKKISFAPMEEAVQLTAMEFGGITPVGLPADWPILIDAKVAGSPQLVIGSGIRGSKLVVSGALLTRLPNAVVLEGLGIPKTNL